MTALYIILGIIALIVILCSVKVKITAEYGEAFSLDVKWLFVKAHIFPQTEEQKAKKAAKKAKRKRRRKRKSPRKRSRRKRRSPPSRSRISSRTSMKIRALPQRLSSFRLRPLSSADFGKRIQSLCHRELKAAFDSQLRR